MMPRLSIITVNLNNVSGLRKTLDSVMAQTARDAVEHIIIDGASTDGSVEVVKDYASGHPNVKWISEPDSGIYNAMNKGIGLATGEYIQILNSADCLFEPDVTARMLSELDSAGMPDILYGNMVKCFPDGLRLRDRCCEGHLTMYEFYHGTLNHDPAYIRRALFDRFGMYDEQLRICSDWKWYLQVVVFGGVKPVYTDIDVTLFDMSGISEDGGKNSALIVSERRQELERALPAAILADYDECASDIDAARRLHRHPWAWRLVRFLERILFKFEKWQKRRSDSV